MALALTENLAELFEGRGDAFYVDGEGCVRTEYQADWPHLWRLHVAGEVNFGIYPLRPEVTATEAVAWDVKWGCSDFDQGYAASWPHAVNLYNTFKVLGVKAWIERSKSKGHHVWVFAEDWCPAEDMRSMFLYAHQLCGAPTTEVNPKAVGSKDVDFVGNCVRMPWHSYSHSGPHGQVMLPPWSPGMNYDVGNLDLVPWLNMARAHRTPVNVIGALALNYNKAASAPKGRRIFHTTETADANVEVLARRLNSGLAFTMWRDGPLPDVDRSSHLVRFARLAADGGKLTPDEVFTLVAAYDEKWLQKYTDRRDAYERYYDIVERAFNG